MKKIFKTLFLISTLLFAFTSCSNSSADAQRPFTVAIVADFQSISPGVDVGALSKSVLNNMNGTLYKYNPDSKLFEPSMASLVENKNGVYTIKLREDLFFHNDQPVTPEDVVYSLKRSAGMIEGVLVNDKNLAGLFNDDSFKVINNTTIEITTNPGSLTTNSTYAIYNSIIVPKNYSEEQQMKNPISAGPYKFVSYTPGSDIVFTKFDKYFGVPVEVNDVQFKIISDTSASLFAFQSGEIDYLSILPEDYVNLKDTSYNKMIYTELANDTNTLFLNSKLPMFADQELRQALKYAINKNELISVVSSEIGLPQASVISPYQENYYYEDISTDEYNPELAKKLLEQKGYTPANPLSFGLKVVAENKVTVNMAKMIKSYLAECNVDVVIYEIPWSSYFDEVYINENFEATILQLAGYDNAYNTLKFFKTDEVGNLSNYSNPEYDEILSKILVTENEDERANLFKQAQSTIFFDTPAIFLGDEGKIVGLSDKYTNVKFYPYWFIDIASIKVAK